MKDLIRISVIALALSLPALGGAQAFEIRVCECGATIHFAPVPLPAPLPVSIIPKPVGPAPIWSPPTTYRLPIAVNPNPIVATSIVSPAPRLPVMTPPILVGETINLQWLAGKVASPMFGARVGQ